MSIWQIAWRVSQQDRRTFWTSCTGFLLFLTFPVVNGWLLGNAFRALSDGDSGRVAWLAMGVAVCEVVRMAAIHVAAVTWTQVWVHMQTLLRANLLAAQMASGGPDAGRPVASAGEALTHFRDDVEDVTMFVDGLVDVSAGLVFTVLAAFVLGNSDSRAAAVLLLPLVAVALATRALDARIKSYRAADRIASEDVGGLIGDLMSAATTVKVNHASGPALERLHRLVDRRRVTAVRDRVLDTGVQAFSQGAADVGLGLVLVVSAGAIASGAFGVGELALFTAYLGWLSFLPRAVGRVLARRKQAGVALDRMGFLLPEGNRDNLVARRALPVSARSTRPRPDPQRPGRVRLETFSVRNLDARFANGAGVTGIDFEVQRGSFTVITGSIGSGKTTLLRAMLGLAHQADVSGHVCWNARPLLDRAAFLIPPNCAFLPQVPQLISDSVADNIMLGPIDDQRLATALALAAVSDDIDEMPDGVNTTIGPRGLRLSGGQRQRVATARALVHSPELIVLDDLSSALDVETEVELWSNLSAAGMTVIAVSHRAVAFNRADRVIHLEAGRQM